MKVLLVIIIIILFLMLIGCGDTTHDGVTIVVKKVERYNEGDYRTGLSTYMCYTLDATDMYNADIVVKIKENRSSWAVGDTISLVKLQQALGDSNATK